MTLWKWSQSASSNATADSTINWAEGMAPSAVNDSARAMMAAAAKYRDDLSGTKISTGGSADAYTVASNQALTTLTDGFRVAFILGATNTGTSTINVDSLGAKPLRTVSGKALRAGELVSGSVYEAAYDSGNDEWLIIGGRHAPFLPAGLISPYAALAAPTGWLICNGQAISRTTYDTLFTLLGTYYGSGNGSTTFNIPDLRGRVVAGMDYDGTGRLDSATLGATQGAKSHTLDSTQVPATHVTVEAYDTGHAHGASTNATTKTENKGVLNNDASQKYTGDGASVTVDVGYAQIIAGGYVDGGGLAHNNVQPTIILNYIISF